MQKIILKKDYKTELDTRETARAIKFIKDTFEREFAIALNLDRISAPLFVLDDSGLNDNLNGTERPVSFDILSIKDVNAEIVHSLAKWKRMALHSYGFNPNEGIYTDMNAIRRDEEVDNLHSIYVDQWDWEKVITKEDRTVEMLKKTVQKIVNVLSSTQELIKTRYPSITSTINKEIKFITTYELEDLYPNKTPSEREYEIVKEYGTVFLMQIGDKLKNGEKHDGRAPDYDDWALNGDILVYNKVLDIAFEISSMGIRVDSKSMKEQLEKADAKDRENLPFHKAVIDGVFPLTMGGGIGQSRLCMLMLEKLHIGEVQASIWPQDMIEDFARIGAKLL